MKLLTIGIPTYNGAETIADAIDSVINQFDNDITKEVDVLISDNNSIDNCYEIVSRYCKKYPDNIKVIKNVKYKPGLDGNLINLFSNSKSEYVWILSDDDMLEVYSIRKVLNIIKRYNGMGLLFVNYSECDKDLNYLPKRLREDIYEDFYCNNGDEFIIKSKMLFGLISSLIINRAFWDKANLDKYIGYQSLHVGAVIEIMSDNKGYVICDKLVRLRTGTQSWGKNGTFIYPILNIVIMLKNLKKNYLFSTWSYATDYFYRNNYISLLKAKYAGLVDFKKPVLLNIKCYAHKPLFWIRDLPIIFIPHFIVISAVNVYKMVSNKD